MLLPSFSQSRLPQICCMSERIKTKCIIFYSTEGSEYIKHIYGQGVGPIWVANVTCNGTEQRLADCRFGAWGQADCFHQGDVGAGCQYLPEPVTTHAPNVPGVIDSGVCK